MYHLCLHNILGLFNNIADEFCTIDLKLSPNKEDPKPVQDHDVPVFTHDKPKTTYTKWDLTTQQVEPFHISLHTY